MLKIKICGLRRDDDVEYANEVLPDYIGFVFAGSKRQVTLEQAISLKKRLNKKIQAVGVFVNDTKQFILSCIKAGAIDVVQLHGDEPESFIVDLKKKTSVPIIRAVRVKTEEDIRFADTSCCDFLLLDAYSPSDYGGTGQNFSWNMIPNNLRHAYFLAGGITTENIGEALDYADYAIDVSGGAEINGYKDRIKMYQLVTSVHGTV